MNAFSPRRFEAERGQASVSRGRRRSPGADTTLEAGMTRDTMGWEFSAERYGVRTH